MKPDKDDNSSEDRNSDTHSSEDQRGRTELSSVNESHEPRNFISRLKKRPAAITAFLVALLAITGSVMAYVTLIVPNQPNNVIRQALANSFDGEAFERVSFEGGLTTTSNDNQTGLATTFIGYSSKDGVFDFSSSTDVGDLTLSLDIRRPQARDIFARVGGLTDADALLDELGSTGDSQSAVLIVGFIQALNDQWLVFEESLIDNIGNGELRIGLSDEDKKIIQDAYLEHEFIEVASQGDNQEIHGIESMQYTVSINKENLVAFADSLRQQNIAGLGQVDDLREINAFDFSSTNIQLWVSKDDKYFTQLQFVYEKEDRRFEVRIASKDINIERQVEMPENAQSVLDILGALGPLLSGGSGDEMIFEQNTGQQMSTNMPLQ